MKFSTFKTSYSKKPFTDMQLSFFASIVHEPELGGKVFIVGARLVNQIRATKDEKIQKQLKQQLPAISPGALFGLDRQDLSNYTGLMQIDIDNGIQDPEQLRNELGRLSWVIFSSLSVRRGVWFLVKIQEPARQAAYWEKVNEWLIKKHGLYADPARKNPKDLRYFAPDMDAIYNPAARPLALLEQEPIINYKTVPILGKWGYGGKGYVSPLDDFNQNADVIGMLQLDGWKISHKKGSKIRFTRPGKDHGTSADWDINIRRLYVFTSNSNLANEDNRHALSPVDILMKLSNISTTHEIRQKLVEMGYGHR
ncbi:MAG: hypothetical protein K0B15_09855 [Lentimicrobium sp.]|nr:hypothetical protein [Lentimicrobium sp.]